LRDIYERLKALVGLDITERVSLSPSKLIDFVYNAYLLHVITVACKLRMFDILVEPHSIQELSRKLNVNPDLLDIICKILVNIGLLEEVDSKYRNSEISNLFLVSKSPYSIFTYILFHVDVMESYRSWKNIIKALKGRSRRVKKWHLLDPVVTLEITLSTGCLQKTLEVLYTIPEFNNSRKVLDLGCGSGIYSIFIAKTFKNVEVYALDLPYVIENITKNLVKLFGLDSRIRLIKADFNKDYIGSNYDIILDLNAVSLRNLDILYKIYNALNNDGIFISRHVFLNDDCKSPLKALLACLWEYVELGNTMTVTFKEARENLERVGFKIENVINLDSEGSHKLIISRK